MGRTVRRVPPDWEHPTNANGNHIPLHDGARFADRHREWQEGKAAWDRGDYPSYASEESRTLSYAEWAGECPDPDDYMPMWTSDEATHYQMYEDTSEGTPLSPVCETPEELARWLTDNGASFFARLKTDYDHWLEVCRGDAAGLPVFVKRQ